MAIFPKLHSVLCGRELGASEPFAVILDGYMYTLTRFLAVRNSLKLIFPDMSDEDIQNVEGKVFNETLLKQMAANRVKSIRLEKEKIFLTTRDEEEHYYYAGDIAEASSKGVLQRKSIRTGNVIKDQTFKFPDKDVITSMFENFKVKMYAEFSIDTRILADARDAFSNFISRYYTKNVVTIQFGDSESHIQPGDLIRIRPADFDENDEKEEALTRPFFVTSYEAEEKLIRQLF